MEIIENELMLNHTTLKVGGPARFFTKVESISDLVSAQNFAHEHKIPFFILGNGSNLLISDNGYNGLIIKLGNFFSKIECISENTFKVGGATPLSFFAKKTLNEGYLGIHKLAGIPGTLGGAIYMNAGAYGEEISDTCTSVESIDLNGNFHIRTTKECEFSYRHSLFQDFKKNKNHAEIIISATFKLEHSEKTSKTFEDVKKETEICIQKRKSTQPLNIPNAGSTFKRLKIGAKSTPEQISPGYYIEQCGLKGFRIGGAEVSTLHANFIVNSNKASASDIYNLINYVQTKVQKTFEISLQKEIILLGF